MAAWSEHEDGPWVETRSALGRRIALADSTTTDNHCPECGEYESECECVDTTRQDPEPFPTEVWTFFSDSDLDQLVTDACAEMGRREMARKS